MADRMQYGEDDARYHTSRLKRMLSEVAEHARKGVEKVHDPKAQALFETTAEVLLGLRKAYEEFELKKEVAWR